MKKLKRLTVYLIIAIILAPNMISHAITAPSLPALKYQAGSQGATISLKNISGGYTMFLPSSAELNALTFSFNGGPITLSAGGKSITVTSGKPFNLTTLYPTAKLGGSYEVTVSRGSDRFNMKIMLSDNIGSIYITSEDPVKKGRPWVEQDKGNKASGHVTILNASGTLLYSGELKQIKGRGNSTWAFKKKPYQIKLADKADLIENNEPQKTWVLLANYYDKAFIRNSLTYDLAAELGLSNSPDNRPMDLYYDGEYRGTYLLSEKVEVGKGRVDIHDLEGDFKDVNNNIEDFDDLSEADGVNAYGNDYHYVTGLSDPADVSGGYLLEMDYLKRASEEKSYFRTSLGSTIVSKSPEYLSQKAIKYISEFYQEFEDAVANGGVNPNTGKSYTDYVDLDSLVKCYLISELSQNGDFFQSSAYFYKPAGEDKLYAGPVWDFDTAYGTHTTVNSDTDMMSWRTTIARKLLKIPSFCEAAERTYENEVMPLINNVILRQADDTKTGSLSSIDDYSTEIAASIKMDRILWVENGDIGYGDAIKSLRNYIIRRSKILLDLDWSTVGDAPRYWDVTEDAWYFTAVNYVIDRGLFNGISTYQFNPQGTMTRGMAVTVLYRLAGTPDVSAKISYTDVPEGEWFTKPISWAVSNEIAHGYPDGSFHPNGTITCQEMVALLYRYAKSMGYDMTTPALGKDFMARESVSDWVKNEYAWAADQGILTDADQAKTKASDSLPRALAASMLQHYDVVSKAPHGAGN